MKNLFSEIYKWAVIFLVGILVGLVAAIKMIDKSSITNIQTGTYVAGLEQKIGKLKQRCEINSSASRIIESKIETTGQAGRTPGTTVE
jgi:hypothetical protein